MQSIIIYRNPIEAMFWESGMVFPLMVGVAASLIIALFVASTFRKSKYQDKIVVVSAIVTMLSVMYWMM